VVTERATKISSLVVLAALVLCIAGMVIGGVVVAWQEKDLPAPTVPGY
jgi:hypothetical protein